ncbi:hypothetical protein VNO78_08015 [Psophocarpus tetragonolobus]|uniref:Uncharacterized protein n=1 Tax=Psophocarpus tetragonolobus TaxID=3891 RepID=A0AAN9SUE0_PSOTE
MTSISSLPLDSNAACNPQRPFSFRRIHPTRNVVVCSAKSVAPPPTKLAATSGRIESLSQVRRARLQVGRRGQRETRRHLGPTLRSRCSLPE